MLILVCRLKKNIFNTYVYKYTGKKNYALCELLIAIFFLHASDPQNSKVYRHAE